MESSGITFLVGPRHLTSVGSPPEFWKNCLGHFQATSIWTQWKFWSSEIQLKITSLKWGSANISQQRTLHDHASRPRLRKPGKVCGRIPWCSLVVLPPGCRFKYSLQAQHQRLGFFPVAQTKWWAGHVWGIDETRNSSQNKDDSENLSIYVCLTELYNFLKFTSFELWGYPVSCLGDMPKSRYKSWDFKYQPQLVPEASRALFLLMTIPVWANRVSLQARHDWPFQSFWTKAMLLKPQASRNIRQLFKS